MAKYDPLRRHLADCSAEEVRLSFRQIEEIIRDSLPPSAHEYREWWANDRTHVQALAWMGAGWKLDSVSPPDEQVVFVRSEAAPCTS